MLSPSFCLICCEFQSNYTKLLLLIKPISIVVYSFTLSQDNLYWNSCILALYMYSQRYFQVIFCESRLNKKKLNVKCWLVPYTCSKLLSLTLHSWRPYWSPYKSFLIQTLFCFVHIGWYSSYGPLTHLTQGSGILGKCVRKLILHTLHNIHSISVKWSL